MKVFWEFLEKVSFPDQNEQSASAYPFPLPLALNIKVMSTATAATLHAQSSKQGNDKQQTKDGRSERHKEPESLITL